MPTRFERKVYTGKGFTTLSYVAEEGFSGIISLNNPDVADDTCFINIRAHERKPGHKVSWPTRYLESAKINMTSRHVGNFQTVPFEFRSRNDRRLKFSAWWTKTENLTLR